MKMGYVSDFTNRTFEEFVQKAAGPIIRRRSRSRILSCRFLQIPELLEAYDATPHAQASQVFSIAFRLSVNLAGPLQKDAREVDSAVNLTSVGCAGRAKCRVTR